MSPAVGAADKASLGVPFAEVVLEDLHELASRGPSFIQENKMAILNQPKLLIVVIITCDGSVGV